MTLAHSTRIAVHILVDDDSGNIAALILAMTGLINLLLGVGQFVASAFLLVSEIQQAMDFSSKVFSIGFKSLAFGFVGLRL